MKALILAAGLGTRLRPLTETIPKPLVLINNKPLLQYHLETLCHFGVSATLINTHYLHEQIENFVHSYNTKKSGLTATTIFEENLLGSAGTLRYNKFFFEKEEDIIVVYGDNLTTINYRKLIEYHKEKGGIITIGTYVEDFPETKGIIIFDETKRISRFIEKPKSDQAISHHANAGIYVVNKNIFKFLENFNDIPLDFGYHIFPYLLAQNAPMYAYEMSEFLLDIGTLKSYTNAQELVKNLHFYD